MYEPALGPNSPFDQLFKSDRGWLIKIGGAGAVGLLIAARIIAWNWNDLSVAGMVLTLIALPTSIMLGATVLVRADSVRRQLRAGNRVGSISRILFASGIWSWLIWVILALLVGFALAIWVGLMTSNQHAG